MTNEEWTHRILEHRIAISDTIAFTDSEAPNSCFSPDRGILYTTYMASRRNYGESGDIVVFGITPLCQPHRSRSIVVAERGVTPCVKNARKLMNCNCFYYETDEVLYTAKTHFGETGEIRRGFVRILFCANGDEYYYADYDIVSDSLSEPRPLLVQYNGKVLHFTGSVFRSYLESLGYEDFNKEEAGETIILSDKFRLNGDGYRYTMATAAWAWPTTMRLKDGSDVMEFVGSLRASAQYEAQSAVVNGRMYVIIRGAKTDDFFVSNDMGMTFHPIGRIDFNTTRPQLLPYKEKLLIAVSKKGMLPNKVRDGRNNILLLYGEGDRLEDYRQVFHVQDALGMVYYDIQDYKGILFMVWSSADLYVDKNPQAKDLLWFVRLGEI